MDSQARQGREVSTGMYATLSAAGAFLNSPAERWAWIGEGKGCVFDVVLVRRGQQLTVPSLLCRQL